MKGSNLANDELIIEQYGEAGAVNQFTVTGSNTVQVVSKTASYSAGLKGRGLRAAKKFFREVFLPQGYPETVSPDYFEYQLWDTLQAFASGINGTLATRSILKGSGVGDETATVLGATMTWLLRDGSGMLGRIVFAYARGTQLDSDNKTWRLVGDVLNDLMIFTDILASLWKPWFTLLACCSSVIRAIVGIAGQATRASLTQHQARANNLADVSAKDGSQETLVDRSVLPFRFIDQLYHKPGDSGVTDAAPGTSEQLGGRECQGWVAGDAR